jgi:hypothetical protein
MVRSVGSAATHPEGDDVVVGSVGTAAAGAASIGEHHDGIATGSGRARAHRTRGGALR